MSVPLPFWNATVRDILPRTVARRVASIIVWDVLGDRPSLEVMQHCPDLLELQVEDGIYIDKRPQPEELYNALIKYARYTPDHAQVRSKWHPNDTIASFDELL